MTITTSNSKPVANAGPDQSVILGATVSLDGLAASDADSDPLSYTWSATVIPSGSSIAALTDPTSTQPSFTPDVVGLYVIQLIVNDGKVDSDPDTATVTVDSRPNRPPVAVNDGYGTNEDTALIVGAGMGVLANDGDPDGNSIAALLGGNAAHGALTLNADGSFTYTPGLNYHGVDFFTYTATDGLPVSDTATATITVQSGNDAPIADAGENQNVATGATVQLSGAASSDPDGDALMYLWEIASKPEGSTAALSSATVVNPTFVADKAGLYQASLVVSDGTVNSVQDVINIEAVTVNKSPVAKDLSIDIAGDTPVTIILRASDSDGDSLTFSTSTNPLHGTLSGTPPLLIYTMEQGYLGSDSFIYQVDDGKGGIGTATVTIDVCLGMNGLVAYYPFNNNANDESGNGNNGTERRDPLRTGPATLTVHIALMG